MILVWRFLRVLSGFVGIPLLLNINILVARRSGVFIVNFDHVSHLALIFLLLTLNMQLPANKLKKTVMY